MAFYVVDNATLKAENPPPPGTSPQMPVRCMQNSHQTRLTDEFRAQLSRDAGANSPLSLPIMIHRKLTNSDCIGS